MSSGDRVIIALIHWRVKLGEEATAAFLKHWQTRNTIANRRGLIAEFLSDSLSMSQFPYITWHLDSESLGNFKSYVTVGFWNDSDAFRDQVAAYFNDDKPLLDFEQYRRRRVIFKPVHRHSRIAKYPSTADFAGNALHGRTLRPVPALKLGLLDFNTHCRPLRHLISCSHALRAHMREQTI